MKHYKLVDKEVVEVKELIEWAEWYETADRKIAKEQRGEVLVSTVFLGIDHQFGNGPPLLFETMIFGGEHDGYMQRYSTYSAAEKGHAKAVALIS